MKRTISFLTLVMFCLLIRGAMAASPAGFKLEGLRSGEVYGPFAFRHGTVLALESGRFRLDRLADERAFSLTGLTDGETFGVYDLVLGRIIDIGDVLYTITRVDAAPTPPRPVPTAPSLLDDTEIALEVVLSSQVPYQWQINGRDGETAQDLERTSLGLSLRKKLIIVHAGMVTAAEWDHTIAGDGNTFENVTLSDGRGWFAGAGLRVPLFIEGRWTALAHGDIRYHREEFSLEYGAWEAETISSSSETDESLEDPDTEAAPANTNTTTILRFTRYDNTATLSETLVSVGLRLSYDATGWYVYAGIKGLLWSDTSLSGAITAGVQRYELSFERKDPLMGYGGIGFRIHGVGCYAEIEAGGENAVNLGLSRQF